MDKTFLNFIDCQKLSRIPSVADSIKEVSFWYGKRDKQLYMSKHIYTGLRDFSRVYLPAYTDADLNVVLPHKIIFRRKTVPKNIYDLIIRKTRNGKYQCEYENQIKSNPSLVQIQGDTEVEAKAKLILFLNKNKLL